MSPIELLDRLSRRGVKLRSVGDRLQAVPMHELNADDREQLKIHKVSLVRLLNGDELPDEMLDPDERQRLMIEMLERLNRRYKGEDINWQKVDEINAKIALTYGRRELTKLLQQYEAAFIGEL